MSDLIGDTSQLKSTVIGFNAVHEATGASGSGRFALLECLGVKHLLSPRAFVRIVSDSLTCQVIGPATASAAVTAHIAVIPSAVEAGDLPTQPRQILTIGGSAFVQHSLYIGAPKAELKFSEGVAHQIKPTPLVGDPPAVVYHYTVTGGGTNSVVHFKISGSIEVDGVGFTRTW